MAGGAGARIVTLVRELGVGTVAYYVKINYEKGQCEMEIIQCIPDVLPYIVRSTVLSSMN